MAETEDNIEIEDNDLDVTHDQKQMEDAVNKIRCSCRKAVPRQNIKHDDQPYEFL